MPVRDLLLNPPVDSGGAAQECAPMKALKLVGSSQFMFGEAAEPELHDDEVLVRVAACGVGNATSSIIGVACCSSGPAQANLI